MMTRFLMWTPSRWPVMRVRTVLVAALIYGVIEAFARAVGRVDVAAGIVPRATFDVSFSGQQFF